MPPQSVLPSVLAHLRAGALAEARRLFREAGLEEERSDPAVLAVRGRLLKDEALTVSGADRIARQRLAAEAYQAAGALSGSTYHLINAASLWRLAGDGAASETVARRVLASLDENPDEPETPYWLAATRAEALLLLGRAEAAQRALTEAVAIAPRAYEDHAPTLRQFRLLCGTLGLPADWLDTFSPPRTLHFAGHMGAGADDADLRRAVRQLLQSERVGFGFGALAAGADIVVAEELLAAGAELDLVLPADPERFRVTSVLRLGADWSARYDAVLAAGVEVKVVGDGGPPTPPALQLAAEAAMGLTALRAQTLQTEALQLVVLDEADADAAPSPGGAEWARRRWAALGRRQAVVPAPRNGGPSPEAPTDPSHRLVAVLAAQASTAVLPALVRTLTGAEMAGSPIWSEDSLLLAFADPLAAADAARRIRAELGEGTRLAAHYGVVTSVEFPGAAAPVLVGGAVDLPRAILAGAPPGAWHVTETFAAGLAAARSGDRPILVGELSGLPVMAL